MLKVGNRRAEITPSPCDTRAARCTLLGTRLRPREPQLPRRSCSHRKAVKYKRPFLKYPSSRQEPCCQTPADPVPHQAKRCSLAGQEDREQGTPRAAAPHRELPGSPEAGGFAQSPRLTELAKLRGVFARPLSPLQGGKYVQVQLGWACCWRRGLPGSQPISDVRRMGGGPALRWCTVKPLDSPPMGGKHRFSSPTACGLAQTPSPSPRTSAPSSSSCSFAPSPFLTANFCSGFIFADLLSRPSSCSLTWQALLLAEY